MKILYVINELRIGGAETLITNILSYIKAQTDNTADLLIFRYLDRILENKLKTKGINLFILNVDNLYNPLVVFKLIPFLRKYDIVHVHLFPALYFVPIAKLLSFSKVQLVCTEHSTFNKRRNKKCLRWIERWIYSFYGKIIAISFPTKSNLQIWLGPSYENKICVIENAIDLDEFKNAQPLQKSDFVNREEAILLLMSARFSPAKDHETLLQAFKELNNPNLYLLLAGEGKLKENMRLIANDLAIDSNVIFLGNRNDVPRIIKTVDICILSSNWEGFGIVALEYMAGGKPVIASDVEGLNHVVKGAGLLFKPKGISELKACIELLVNDEVQYRNLVRSGYKRVEQYKIENLVQSYLKVYKSLVK